MRATLYPWFRRKPGRIYFTVSSEDRIEVLAAHVRLGSASPKENAERSRGPTDHTG